MYLEEKICSVAVEYNEKILSNKLHIFYDPLLIHLKGKFLKFHFSLLECFCDLHKNLKSLRKLKHFLSLNAYWHLLVIFSRL